MRTDECCDNVTGQTRQGFHGEGGVDDGESELGLNTKFA